ncbi:MAG: multidrug efflux SMR transporter [Anaerovoracaceae bacterium]|nr:multidrug efflux SMR transporter [Anaerovoracaceae bacterium]
MKWIYLGLAGILEITWAVGMKYSEGFTVLIPSIVTIAGYLASAVFLSLAMRGIPLGTVYALWTGIGIIGTTLFGYFVFHEPLGAAQVICIAMIGAGITGLRLL